MEGRTRQDQGAKAVEPKGGGSDCCKEPVVVNQGAQESIPDQAGRYDNPICHTDRPARLHRLAESIPELRKRLQIRAQ
jgi:hypothetical protein